jgi:hypothetical protein
MRRTAVGAVVAAMLFALAACTPGNYAWFNKGATSSTGQTQGKEIRMQPVADDSGAPGGSIQILCTGETSWRTGNYVNVNNPANLTIGGVQWWTSTVYCPAGRWVTGVNFWRHW